MPEPIDQDHHYLPIFYLRRWCGADRRVTRYHRPYIKVVPSRIAPKSTANVTNLYKLEGMKPGEQQAVETQYMTPLVDTPASKIIGRLIKGELNDLDPEQRSDFTRFLMAMRLRNPSTLDEVTALARAMMKLNMSKPDPDYDAFRSEGDPTTLYEWIEKNHPGEIADVGKKFLPGLIEHEEIGNHTINMQWATYDVGVSGRDLITGDRPLIATDGLKRPACIVALALSPSVLFVATNNREAQRPLIEMGPNRLAVWFNEHMVRQARFHVFGSHDRHLLFVERRLLPSSKAEPPA